MADTPTVFQALAEVSKAVGAVRKTQKGQGVNFSYRGIEQVLNALHDPMSTHGVVFIPRVIHHEQYPQAEKPGPWTRTTVVVEYDVYGPAGDCLPKPLRVTADALDNNCFGYGKAMSYAYKTALGQVFSIPTEEDAEATTIPEAKAAPAPAKQAKKQPPRVPDGEPFEGPSTFAPVEAVEAVLAEIDNSPDGIKSGLALFMTDKKLPGLRAHKDKYPAVALRIVETKLSELQDKADDK